MATIANCGCDLVSCDACSKLVPKGEIGFCVAYGIDTYACAECRGTDPELVHPTCIVCGTCQDCDC